MLDVAPLRLLEHIQSDCSELILFHVNFSIESQLATCTK